MVDGCVLVKEMESMLKEWEFIPVDAKGRSKGLILGWRSRKFLLLNAWSMNSSLCVALHSFELQLDLCFINLYGPYTEREVFWNNLLGMNCFSYPNLVVGGDLKFSLGHSEIWGAKARVDVLSDFFIHLLEGLGLIDITPLESRPTWSNRRIVSESIYKRLDRILLSADFLDSAFLLRQWIACGGDLDHQPVFLQILPSSPKAHCPFKFNACWLENTELVDSLKASWMVFNALSELSPASQFVVRPKQIKNCIHKQVSEEKIPGYYTGTSLSKPLT